MHNWNLIFVVSHLLILSAVAFVLCRLVGLGGAERVVAVPLRRRFLALLVLAGLAGCASHEKLAVASGPVFALNPDHWQATPADLAAPDSGK